MCRTTTKPTNSTLVTRTVVGPLELHFTGVREKIRYEDRKRKVGCIRISIMKPKLIIKGTRNQNGRSVITPFTYILRPGASSV